MRVKHDRLQSPTVGSVASIVGLCLMVAVLAFAGDYTLYVLALVVTQAIAIQSLNLLMGYAGQVSLGQAAFVGTGAYAAAEAASRGVPFPAALLIGSIFAAAVAAIVGLPSLRIKGLQVAATTLAFGVVAEHLLFVRPWVHGAGTGIAAPRPHALVGGRPFLLVTLGCLLAVLVLDRSIRRSRIGRAFLAVRDREDTASAKGINVGRTKLLAYALSGSIAGLAGGLFAFLLEHVTPGSFTVFTSLGYVAAVVVGGLGSWTGAILAGVVFAGLPELLRPAAAYSPLAGAMMLMLVPVVRPEGFRWLLDRRIGRRAATPADVVLDPDLRAAERIIAPPRRALSLSMPVASLLRAEDVSVSFGGLQALQSVTFEVMRGEIVGLIGPNGAGKSTFFNCLSGLVRPDIGTIAFRSRDLLASPTDARPSLGIVRTFQQVGLCAPQTVWENMLTSQHELARYSVAAGLLRLSGMRASERALAERARAALRICGIDHLASATVGALSHGDQRLAEVASAIALGPELLLLDEPFAGSGPEESEALASRLRELRDRLGLTMIVIEHDVPLIASLSDHVYVLAEGRVLTEGTPSEVQTDEAVIAAYIGAPIERIEVAAGA